MSSKDWQLKIYMMRDESAKIRPPQFSPIRLDKQLYETNNTVRIRHYDFQLDNTYPMRNIEIYNRLLFQFLLGPLSPTYDPSQQQQQQQQQPQEQQQPQQEQQLQEQQLQEQQLQEQQLQEQQLQEQQLQEQTAPGQYPQQGGAPQQVVSTMEVGFLFKGIVQTQQPITTYSQRFSLSLLLDDIFVTLDGVDRSKEYMATHEILKVIDRINNSISPTAKDLTEIGWNLFDTLNIDLSPYVTHLYNTITGQNPAPVLVNGYARMPNDGDITITGAKQ